MCCWRVLVEFVDVGSDSTVLLRCVGSAAVLSISRTNCRVAAGYTWACRRVRIVPCVGVAIGDARPVALR